MTKRLSEIGCERWAYEEWREWSSFDLTTQKKWGNPEKLILLTPDQRRELVREVWRAAVESVRPAIPGMYVSLAAGDVEQFIKEQEL